jgi:hypothetical protein
MPRDIEKGIDLPSRTGAVDRDSIDLSAFPVEPWEWDDANEVSEPDLTLVDPWSLILEKNLTLSGNLSFGAQYPGVNSVTDDDYTVTDSDGYSVILVSTGASDRTVDLPTAGDNTHRLITVVKVDSGAGKVTVDAEAGEDIHYRGQSQNTIDFEKEDSGAIFISDGSNWRVLGVIGCELWDIGGTIEAVYTKIFNGTTDADAQTLIAHGISDHTKIISVSAQINTSGSSTRRTGATAYNGQHWNCDFTDTNIDFNSVGGSYQDQSYDVVLYYYI